MFVKALEQSSCIFAPFAFQRQRLNRHKLRGIGVRRNPSKQPAPLLHGGEARLCAGFMLLERHHGSPGDIGESLVDMRFGPCQIIVLLGHAFVDELAKGVLDRGKVPARDVGPRAIVVALA